MINRAEAHIDLAALQHNLQIVKSKVHDQPVMAMIKANGYGHGLLRCAKALEKADAFGVACLEEAILLRDAGITKPIVLMTGITSVEELKTAGQYQLSIVVHHPYQAEILQKNPLSKPLDIWLKIDTGMHRLGLSPEKFESVYQQLSGCQWIKQPMGLMTHFADADDVSKKTTQNQLDCFRELTINLPGEKSMANSAGILLWPESYANWVRPGIMLYGISPFSNHLGREWNLKPVMTFQSKLIAINELHRGDAVGYGGTWICPENMRVGVVAAGYGDGYPRHAKNGTPVLVNDTICPLVGRVSMDLMTVDLRNCKDAKINDPVILWGGKLPVEEVAAYSDTIPYTLVCGVTQRVKFIEGNLISSQS